MTLNGPVYVPDIGDSMHSFHDCKMDCYAFVLIIIKIYLSYCICSCDHYNMGQICLCITEWSTEIKKNIFDCYLSFL